ncbi:MAG: EAL domain-containing protein [Treponema sp.]|nr:EAL domain-containing protein [Treponema sp.]
MNEYIIYFDVAALCVLLFIIISNRVRKNLPITQNRIFFLFLIDAIISTFCDLTTTLIRGNILIPKFVFWIAHLAGYTATFSLPLIGVAYCISFLSLTDRWTKKRVRTIVNIFAIPYLFFMLFLWFSPVYFSITGRPLAFYINDEHIYCRGNFGFYFMYLLVVYCIGGTIVLLFKYSSRIKISRLLVLLFGVSIIIVTAVIQLLFPQYLVQSFGLSLTAIMFSTFVQTPEEYVDKSTDLFNELAFINMTTKEFDNGSDFICISIILDDIAFISNTYDVRKLNELLRQVSDYLNTSLPSATVYYLPQGKFCILMKDQNIRERDRILFELKVRFQKPWKNDNLELKLYCRICVIECPQNAKKTEDIMDILDIVANDTRYKRSSTYSTIYAKDIDISLKTESAKITRLLHSALREHKFEVYYQPIYNTKEERLIGGEALLRLKDEQGKFISPEIFIPIAEKTGDILSIGSFVFETVCSMLESINPEEYGIRKIDVNLSVVQCMQELLAEEIASVALVRNVPTSLINLEITETGAAHTPEILLDNMKRLAQEGIELSLDDYGSGYSNMSYMLNLPFRMVKIDKYIVWAAYSEPRSAVALEATIQMIHKIGMTVLAEGVETKEQVEWLKGLGCDFLQGYYYAKALPKDEFLALMKKDKQRFDSKSKAQSTYSEELAEDGVDELLEEL